MNFLHPHGELDVLNRYSKVAPILKDFLKNKDIATKIIGPNFTLLKRGTILKPLNIKDFDEIDKKYLQIRAKNHLKDVRKQLSPKQILLRQYFFPRKLVNFFYACNNEYGKNIERIFIDIDRQNNSADDARKVTLELIKTIKKDKKFQSTLGTYRLLTLWTGSSFHVYLLLKRPIDHTFYDKYLSYGEKKEESFINKRATHISKKTNLTVIGGHARVKNAIILDTSNTPPGKLARCPFSLHIKNAKTINGIAVPVSEEELANSKLISNLQKLTAETIRKNIDKYIGLLK